MSGAPVGKDKVARGHPRAKEPDDFRCHGKDLGRERDKVGGRWSGCGELLMGTPDAVRRVQ